MTAAIHHHRFFHHVDAVTLHQLLEQIEDLFCPGTLECKDPWVDNQNSNSLGINCAPRSPLRGRRRRGGGLMKAQSYYFPCQHRFLWLIFKNIFYCFSETIKTTKLCCSKALWESLCNQTHVNFLCAEVAFMPLHEDMGQFVCAAYLSRICNYLSCFSQRRNTL